MSLVKLVQLLLDFSERAAVIARTIREEETLFQLLVEEKTGEQKNERFAQDFKTLADVLIQQTLCYQVEKQLPALAGRVHGEECAVFSNSVGETVTVAVQDTQQATAQLLAKVLDGNKKAAETLAHEVHRSDIKSLLTVDKDLPSVPLEQLAVWIDPIDSTGEYIRGDSSAGSCLGLGCSLPPMQGLSCVTVLVGVFRTTDGAPLAGVVNQPFWGCQKQSNECSGDESHKTGCGAAYWGVAGSSNSLSSTVQQVDVPPLSRVVLSSSEQETVQSRLRDAGLQCIAATGAGYKALVVISGDVQAYLCSKASTYMWDTCAPHAILLSLGGGIVPYSALHLFSGPQPADHSLHQLHYTEPAAPAPGAPVASSSIEPFCNTDGLVAYRHVHHLLALANILAECKN